MSSTEVTASFYYDVVSTARGTCYLSSCTCDYTECIELLFLCSSSEQHDDHVECVTGGNNRTGDSAVTVRFGKAQRRLQEVNYRYTPDPNVTNAVPAKSFLR